MDKLGIGRVKNGDVLSDKFRKLIDVLYIQLGLSETVNDKQSPQQVRAIAFDPSTSSLQGVGTLYKGETAKPLDTCSYRAEISDTQIECSRLLEQGKKPLKLSKASCDQCFIRQKKEGFKPQAKVSQANKTFLDKTGSKYCPKVTRWINPFLPNGRSVCELCKQNDSSAYLACQEFKREQSLKNKQGA